MAFPDQLIAADQRDGSIPAVDSTREIEGRDDADGADRVPLL